ncbi:uncharacterized protein N7482_007561 [Penicillium canariense]|uniref:Uncharacterized protein n=1 Tax=Penicillium canariense TaxID=189055 RepID=A0A9W9HZX3_9EURO|nr:uncharacterized protein N7482_007561 [Penicillium canariense]KAJ5160557.1 hypothetical protein N7482_007561 [Penicillium canariense]
MATHNHEEEMEQVFIDPVPSINWGTWVEPLDMFPTQPDASPLMRDGEGQGTDAYRASRHPWDVVDYYLYLNAVEKGCHDWETRFYESQVVDSHKRREKESLGPTIDSDDPETQQHWEEPLILFASLPVPHAHLLPHRKFILGYNSRHCRLSGYLFETAPDTLANLGEVWDQRKLIINIPLDRFIQILKYAATRNPAVLQTGMFNFFHETTRHLHAGMDMVLAIKCAQFINDAVSGAIISDPSHIVVPSDMVDIEEKLRDILCRASHNAWFSAHKGQTAEQFREHGLVKAASSNLFSDQLSPPSIVNDEAKAKPGSCAPVEQNTSSLLYKIELPQLGLTTLEIVRQWTFDSVLLLMRSWCRLSEPFLKR